MFLFVFINNIFGDIMNDKVCGYYLDTQQQKIVLDNSKYLLVVAGAGSGKTLTILGKINYLIKYKNILPNEILCISFTRASANNLKEKLLNELSLEIPVYTFHKLALEIIKEDQNIYEITDKDTLSNVIHSFFYEDILEDEIYMKKVLRYFGIKDNNYIKQKYLKLLKFKFLEIEMLEKLVSTFLHLFKCNNFLISDFLVFLNKCKKDIFNFNRKKEQIFLLISLNIYLIYQKYLEENKEIDFDDMIINASKIVKRKGIKNKYKYVIIDEYQDTSYIRFLLIKNIIEYVNAKLMVVGDDFQSIYSFTGCDISLFLKFNEYFENAKIMKIENTYRNSNQLVKVASNFIMRNPRQIKKNLKSNKNLPKPIKIILYKNIRQVILKLILDIYNKNHEPILILGRNNRDIELILSDVLYLEKENKIIYKENKDIQIYYLTVHKSKGLEEENVIIINLEDNYLGFPNKIKNEKVLRFVNNCYDKYPFSEERRLFYVALTRTKNCVYLLTPIKNKSIFVNEILKEYKYIEIEKYY